MDFRLHDHYNGAIIYEAVRTVAVLPRCSASTNTYLCGERKRQRSLYESCAFLVFACLDVSRGLQCTVQH